MSFLIYGAYGYTGELLAEEAVARGHHPVLAGRSAEKLRPLADRLGLPFAALSLDDVPALARALVPFKAVLNAAGPFVHTALPMMQACLAAGVHYTDVNGEIEVFEQAFSLDEPARDKGVTLLPGAGFDVVPTDCLARHVSEQVPGAHELSIAFAPGTTMSGGTARSTSLHAGEGGVVRRDGRLVPHPLGKGIERLPFPDRDRLAMPIPWGDLSTAFRTTGIANITTYVALPTAAARVAQVGWPAFSAALPLLRSKAGQAVSRWALTPRTRGPKADQRATRRCAVWARARGFDGEAQAWLVGPEAYELTRVAAIRAVERLLVGVPPGATTPALAFGKDFVLEIPGTRRFDARPA